MTLPTEAVTLAGSGLVFINDYDASVSAAYRGAIVSAENFLQSHFSNSLTVNMQFDLSPLGMGASAENNFTEVNVSYATFTAALRTHAFTTDDQLSVNGLPATDPSHGAGFAIPTAEAVMLGLAAQSNQIEDSVSLNSNLNFTFGQDAIGAIEHEISEGVFGRTSSLGFDGTRWNPLDLFRFTANGQRDFTGGSDGVTTFFGIDANHVSTLAYHNAISATGANDGFDLGDWGNTRGDAFGPGGPGSPGTVSAVDLQVLDILGWNPTGAVAFTPAPDDFANSLGDTTHPFGQLTPGGSATGALQQAGDHDLFAVQLQAGGTYTISETGHSGGGGTLGDPFLQLRDASGNVVASNDDITDGSNPDSRLVFTTTTGGTFYVDAGGFADGYTGSYRVSVSTSSTPTASPPSGQMITGGSGNDSLQGGAGDDTLTGGGGNDTIDGGTGVDTADYAAARSNLTVSYANGAYHVTDLGVGSPEGSDTVTNTEYFSFAGTTMSVERALLNTNAAIGDFNGDGEADILWRDPSTGATDIWEMSGTHTVGGGFTAALASPGWSIIGTGDFGGDGKADILWRNDLSGSTVIWNQNGAQLLDSGATSTQAGNDWYVAGIADFSGDGKADILWRNLASEGTVVWSMNGAAVTGAANTDAFAPAGWSVAGTGDFNGDGKADILWRNDTDGSTVIWEQNGGHLVAAGFTSAYAPAPWTVAGVADFNGDGHADILWRNVQTDQTVIWGMNGTTLIGGGPTDSFAPAGWSVAGTGDFNGDGKADILWRNDTTHQTVIWEMDGQHVVASAVTDNFAPAGWVFT